MPPKKDGQLRIYCLCGQKMKVSESMFGRPGKCVACRQKIRIPNEGEIPEGTKEIHLKEHPEFLRKARKPVEAASVEAADAEIESVEWSPPADFDIPTTVPLEALEPLRVLASLDLKLERGMRALSDTPQEANERATMQSIRDRLQGARERLDEQLGSRLVETAGELAGIGSKLLQLGVSARTGDITFFEFRETSEILRKRRDQLEHVVHNIRGWLAARDPYTAGGYLNVSLDEIPDVSLPKVLPGGEDDARPLVEQHVADIREAFAAREGAERRLHEAERMDLAPASAAQPPSAMIVNDFHAECEAAKVRADATIAFLRQRLNQLAEDCSSDLQVLQACLERERARLNAGQVSKGRFRAVQSGLVGIRSDVARVHEMVTRALIASGTSDVPLPEGTLIRRLPHGPSTGLVGKDWDALLAWASALVWGLAVFLPLVKNVSLLGLFREAAQQGRPLPYFNALPVLVGLVVTVAGALPRSLWRGATLLGLWAVFTVGGFMLLHAADASPLAKDFHESGLWFLRPAITAMVIADLAMLAAAVLGLLDAFRKQRRVVATVVAIVAAGVLVTSLSMFGSGKPRPVAGAAPLLPRQEMAAVSDARPSTPVAPARSEKVAVASIPGATPEPASSVKAPESAGGISKPAGTIVQLRGLGGGAAGNPVSLMLRVQAPGVPQRDIDIKLGGTVSGEWKATEYNPQLRTVTVSDGDNIRILHVGEPATLDAE